MEPVVGWGSPAINGDKRGSNNGLKMGTDGKEKGRVMSAGFLSCRICACLRRLGRSCMAMCASDAATGDARNVVQRNVRVDEEATTQEKRKSGKDFGRVRDQRMFSPWPEN